MRCHCHGLHPCPNSLGLLGHHHHSDRDFFYGAVAGAALTPVVAPVVDSCADAFCGAIGGMAKYAFSGIPPYQPPQPTPPPMTDPGMTQAPHPSTLRRPPGSPTSVVPSAPSSAEPHPASAQRKFLCCVHKDCARKSWYYTREVGQRCCVCAACVGLTTLVAGCVTAITCAALQSS